MGTRFRVGLVVGGYVVAFLLALAVVAFHAAHVRGPDMGSSGMYAFGDSLLFLAVFALAAIFPTGAAFFFLRSSRIFWIAIAVVALAVSATGLVAFGIYFAERGADSASVLHAWSVLAVARILVAPLFGLMLFLSALFAPNRSSRTALVAATAIETLVFICVGLIWFYFSRSF
jgi:hypothetical protein